MAPHVTRDQMEWTIKESIGPNRSILPSGFLLCTDVPLARVGLMMYAPGETPVRTGPKGYVEIERSPDEVFSPISLASYSAAPLVDEHPTEDVTPQNWRALAHGVVINARRGDKELSEFVVGDIVVKSPELIEAVQQGKREVSVGYLCDYDEMEPGKGRQRNIMVNHVALVERGRCGARCAIGDKAPAEIPDMTKKTNDGATLFQRAIDRVRAVMATKDEAGIEKELKGLEAVAALAADPLVDTGPEKPENHVHLHLGDEFPPKKDDDKDDDEKKDKDKKTDDDDPYEARFAALEAALGKIVESIAAIAQGKTTETNVETEAEQAAMLNTLELETPAGTMTGDSAAKLKQLPVLTKDSAVLHTAFIETVSLAEILTPGIKAPTFDKALPAKATFDSICQHRRQSLARAAEQPALHAFIVNGLRGKTFDSMTCDETRTLFKSAAALKSALNNTSRTADSVVNGQGIKVGKITSIADLNKFAKDKYGHKPATN